MTVTNTANNLKNWLDGRTVGEKPIFVISHVPLHYSLRAREKGDAQYAKLIVDVLNEAGQRGLNIIFLYGHNHNEANAGYMGGSTNFVAKGEKIWVSNTDGTTLPPTERTINFTYMNAGFVGWFGNVKENTTDVLTMSVFQISGDDVTITRYSKDGVFPLQEKVGTFYTGESGLGYTVDSTTQKSPYTVRGNSIELTVSDEIRNKALGVGGFATVSVSNPDAGMKYTWHSANDDVATVVDNGDGSATICGWSEGTAMIRVSATSAAARSNETIYSEFYVTVQGKAAVDSGTYFYQRVNGLEDGKQYVITTGLISISQLHTLLRFHL